MNIDRKKLIVAMLDRDINIMSLTAMSGLSRVTLSNIKCGKSCSDDTIRKIANALKVDVSELIKD